jgi:hypothetical protein
MPGAESMIWVAAVTVVILLGLFVFCLSLDRRIRRLEEEQ